MNVYVSVCVYVCCMSKWVERFLSSGNISRKIEVSVGKMLLERWRWPARRVHQGQPRGTRLEFHIPGPKDLFRLVSNAEGYITFPFRGASLAQSGPVLPQPGRNLAQSSHVALVVVVVTVRQAQNTEPRGEG